MKSLLLKIVLLLVLIPPVFGQNGKLLFHHLRMEDGLSDQTNLYVYKDSGGFIWISSVNGLNRFDGTTVKVYLPDPGDPNAIYGENIQSNFYEDDSGMWFCTYQAINFYDPKQDAFEHYTISEGKDNLPGYHIFHQDKSSNLWLIVENKGVYVFNTKQKKFKFISPLK